MRMEQKGWLSHRVDGRTHVYSATVPRETTVAQRVLEVVDKVCGGSSETLVAALLDHGSLTMDELDRIRILVSEAKRKRSR
jgi:predicted transcriptional regulator